MPSASASITTRRRESTYTAVNLWILLLASALVLGALPLAVIGRVLEPVGILLFTAAALLITVRTVVTIEPHGVRARIGIFGFPRRFVGTDTIDRATVITVRPVRDFGGWGDRYRRGTRAFVARGGEAIRIGRTQGPVLVVTIDDAERAAARINAFVDEYRAGAQPPGGRPRSRKRAAPRPF